MRRASMLCVEGIALLAITFSLVQQGRAQTDWTENQGKEGVKGRYAFTLTEKCVHQLSFNVPGFDSNFQLVDPLGAETYSGASDGLIIFDGKGNASIKEGRATNIMNASNRLLQPTITPVPLGFGLGPALPFTCHGTYSVKKGKITVPLTCDAKLELPNVFNSTGFESMFTFEGTVPADNNSLLLTDIGNTVHPVTIFFNTNPQTSVMQQRICTRSAALVRVSP